MDPTGSTGTGATTVPASSCTIDADLWGTVESPMADRFLVDAFGSFNGSISVRTLDDTVIQVSQSGACRTGTGRDVMAGRQVAVETNGVQTRSQPPQTVALHVVVLL